MIKKILDNEFSEEKIQDMMSSFSANIDHDYLLERFSVETRVKINKDPVSNLKPQVELNLILGGMFDEN